jgi:hypothetical protein
MVQVVAATLQRHHYGVADGDKKQQENEQGT